MKETTDYTENIMDIIHTCRKKNDKIGARQKHFYLDKDNIRIHLSGNAQLTIPIIIAENGANQLTKGAIQAIVNTFEQK